MRHAVRCGTRYLAALSMLAAALYAHATGLVIPEISANTMLVINTNGDETLFRHGHRTNVQVVIGNGSTVASGANSATQAAPVHAHVADKPTPFVPTCPGSTLHAGGTRIRRDYSLNGTADTVVVSAPANVCIQEGPAIKVTVVADEILQPLLVPVLSHATLTLAPSNVWTLSHTPSIVVTVPHLARLRAYNGGSIRFEALHGDHLELLTSKGTAVTGTGEFRSLHADVSEGATVTPARLRVGAADLDVSDGASFYAEVSGDLRVKASEGALVHIDGNPNVVSSENIDGGKVVIE